MNPSQIASDKVNILLVDDRPEGVMTLAAVLDNPSYRLIKAYSGKEALARVLEYDFALILLDVQMPDMDGFETAELIKQREKSKHIPIIFVTAISKDNSHVYRGYEAGGVDYIFKPLDSQILKSKVAIYIDLFRKNQQLRTQAKLLKEGERRERVRQLAAFELESTSRYRNLAESIPHIVWKCKADGTLDYCNKLWTIYTGLSLEQSLGNGWQLAIHKDDLDGLIRSWHAAYKEKATFETECRIHRFQDHEYRWHLFRAVPELLSTGEVAAWISTCSDIDDRKHLERDLVHAKDNEAAANKAKTSFLANMSHEIRTPLGVVLGYAEILEDQNLSPSERRNAIDAIKRNGELLSHLIGDILDLSKVEAGRVEVERVSFQLVDLINTAIKSMEGQASKKGISLELAFDGPVPQIVQSDPTRLRQILFNIVGNAIKFTEKGVVRVIVSANKTTHLLKIDVIDQGIGISESQKKKMFNPFIQADSTTTRKFGGTGLGLSLSRKLAKILGGDIVLTKSQPGIGSTFTISIDVGSWKESQDLDQERGALRVVRAEPPRLDGVKILLVEDSPDNQALLDRFLSIAGAEVEIAENGRQGVDRALQGDHDLVLMDIQMPVLDGYDAVAELRRQKFGKPVVALTAHALKEDRERCLSAGYNDYLMKPVDRKLLIDTVASHVGPSTESA